MDQIEQENADFAEGFGMPQHGTIPLQKAHIWLDHGVWAARVDDHKVRGFTPVDAFENIRDWAFSKMIPMVGNSGFYCIRGKYYAGGHEIARVRLNHGGAS